MKIQYILLIIVLIILNMPLYRKIHKTMFPSKGEYKNSFIKALFSDDSEQIYFGGRRTSSNAEYFIGIIIAIVVVELGVLYWARHIYLFYN